MLPTGHQAEIDADAVRTSTKTRRGKASAFMDKFTSRRDLLMTQQIRAKRVYNHEMIAQFSIHQRAFTSASQAWLTSDRRATALVH